MIIIHNSDGVRSIMKSNTWSCLLIHIAPICYMLEQMEVCYIGRSPGGKTAKQNIWALFEFNFQCIFLILKFAEKGKLKEIVIFSFLNETT